MPNLEEPARPASVPARRGRTPCWYGGEPTLVRVWTRWQQEALVCDRGGRVAVTVKATPPGDRVPAVYRLLCVRCGNESPWFEVDGEALHIVADEETSPTLASLEEDLGTID
jgi:hypothetical protein